MSRKSSKAVAEFLWIPGQGADADAINRMKYYFLRPTRPMGEAWFMGGEREMYHDLMGDLNKLSIDYLQEMFGTIGRGTSSFGPFEEWNDWFHYLLGQLMHKAHDCLNHPLLEYIMTAFMNIYPHGIENEPYPGFREDALNTLGKSLMDAECWDGQNTVRGKALNSWSWDRAAGDFSSSMFFCLKYLNTEQFPGWGKSALSINSPLWRAQIMVWLVGADKILKGKIAQPKQFKGYPSIEWQWSHCICGCVDYIQREKKQFPDFIPQANRNAFLETVRQTITEDIYLEWLSSISQSKEIETGMLGIPWLFEEIYFPKA